MVLDTDNIFSGAKNGADEFFEEATDDSVRPNLIIKETDEDAINNTTLQNDDELFINVEANSTYEFELELWVINDDDSSPGRFKGTFNVPTGTIGTWKYDSITNLDNAWDPSSFSAFIDIPYDISTEIENTDNSDSVSSWLFISGKLSTSNTAGRLQLKWSQISNSATATTVKALSSIKLIKFKSI